MSYGQKRDRWIVLSSNMSWECITVILAFCNHLILFHMLLFTPPLMQKVCSKMVPKLLNDDQKDRMQVCQDIIERLQTEPDLLCRVNTDDETWISEYDPETKRQSCQCHHSPTLPRPKKARQSKSKVKVMLIIFFDVRGISSTVSSCHRARQSISKSTKRSCAFCFAQCTRRDMSCGRTNRGCFTTAMHLLTMPCPQFLAKKNIAVREQPPYSPDIVPFPQAQGDHQGDPF